MRSVKDLMNLEGRVALVTGGGGHIGSAICDALGELGTSIVVLDLLPKASAETAARVRETRGVETMDLVADLSDEASVRQVPDAVMGRFGRLDILVNCASLVGTSDLKGWAVPFAQQLPEAFRRAVDVGLIGPLTLTQGCADALAALGHGSIINVGSIYGIVGPDMALYEGTEMANPAGYAAAKGGLLQLTRWLATVLAPEIRVNAVSPGGVWRDQPEEFHKRYVARTPLRRMAREEDLKGAVAYLASDLSAYVTGHNLVVDGGWTAW